MVNVFIHREFEEDFSLYPLTSVEAGAKGGVAKHWGQARRFLHYIGFEPDNRSYGDIARDGNVTLFPDALWSEETSRKLYLTRDPGASSVYPPNTELLTDFCGSERFEVVEEEEIKLLPLDKVLPSHGIGNVDFLKFDAQGAELEILKGGADALRGSLGVEVEVEFVEVYRGQPLFAQVHDFLTGHGFELFDLNPYYWKRKGTTHIGAPKGQLIFADAVYLQSMGTLKDTVSAYADYHERRAKALKAISVSLVYGYLDYALSILEQFHYLFEDRLYQLARRNLSLRLFSSRLPFPQGRQALASQLRRLVKLLEPHSWQATDNLGNIEWMKYLR